MQGWWRVPWSENNKTFQRSPFLEDCLGMSLTVSSDVTTKNVTEGCHLATTGPLCSICIEGYIRDGSHCNPCDDSSVPMRVGVLLGIIAFMTAIILYCRRKVRKKWQMYRPLWRDFLRVISINITFAQINSSLPYVLEVQWPPEWHKFVSYFDVVNIDLMSLIGISCIGDYNYYVSFIVMMCLPISITILALTNFHCARTSMQRRLRTLTDQDKINMEEEALHSLFHLADADHSGEVDSAELAGILKALGWEIDTHKAHEMVEKITSKLNDHGILLLSEEHFLANMLSGKMKELADALNSESGASSSTSSIGHKSSSKRMSLVTFNLTRKKNMLSNRDELIKWTLRKNIVASSLSGATQLLMLAHTPVSRKVFQYFDCNTMSGRRLLRADYDINCNSAYYAFMPVVLIVLVGFIVALPGVISFYLWRHRKELYSTSVYQTIGWLYESYVRGAEFWQVSFGKSLGYISI